MKRKQDPNTRYLMNGAGVCKKMEDVERLCLIEDTSAILLGSVTFKPRMGNSGNVWHTGPEGALNALGMPNLGIEEYVGVLPDMVALAHGAGKEFGISIAAIDSLSEYNLMAKMAEAAGVDFIELNFGCPNVKDGKPHRILTFDLEGCRAVFDMLAESMDPSMRIYVKVSIISDPMYLTELASLINDYPIITGVTATNTFPKGYGRDGAGKTLISGDGFAGVSGLPLKYISLGQATQWRSALLPEKEIIAVGGISSGKDIRDYALSGATGFQIVTAYLSELSETNQGGGIFGTVLAEDLILAEEADATVQS